MLDGIITMIGDVILYNAIQITHYILFRITTML